MVKEGYKQTEIGLIPEDWEVKSLDSISNITMGQSPKSMYYNSLSIGLPLVQGNADILNRKTIVRNYTSQITKKAFVNDIIMSVRAPVGEIAKNLFDCCIGRGVCAISTKSEYLYHYLVYYENEWGKLSTGSTFDSINSNEVRNLLIPIPPKEEQKEIAKVLSDTDELITSIEKLISKKEAIKQGTMQQLLTGKKRLSGFSGEWEERNLNDICWFQEGPGLRKWQFTNKGIKVINVTNLVNGYLELDKTNRHISMEEFEKMYKHFEIDENDILMASSGNSYSKVSIVRKKDLRLVMNTSVIRFKPLINTDYNFLHIFLKSTYFKEQIDLLITGGAQPNFGPFHLNKIVVNIPSTIEEQNKIGQIISDMDNEIESLKSKLSKTKAIKDGIMSELLTGKTRLKVKDE